MAGAALRPISEMDDMTTSVPDAVRPLLAAVIAIFPARSAETRPARTVPIWLFSEVHVAVAVPPPDVPSEETSVAVKASSPPPASVITGGETPRLAGRRPSGEP